MLTHPLDGAEIDRLDSIRAFGPPGEIV
jgi:hypothetical protein